MVRQFVHSPADERGGSDAPALRRTPEEVRALFPAIANHCYLNSAASSPLCEPVARAVTAHIEETVQRGDAGFMRWLDKKERVRAQFAAFIGADKADIAFTPNTSMGFHAAAQLMLARGINEVVTTEAEFPSTTVPLLNAGLTLRAVKARPDGSFHVDDLAKAVTANTGAIAVSQVQFASGFQLDVAAVGDLCRERKLFFALNACQALGQVRVDVNVCGADVICGTSHKWLMGGFGGGVFYARREHFAHEAAPWAGWLSSPDAWAMDALNGAVITEEPGVRVGRGTRNKRTAVALEAGSHAWTPIYGLGASLEVLESVGIVEIARHNRQLQLHLREQLRARGFSPSCPDESAAGICVVKVNGPPDEAARSLAKEGVIVSARGGGLRIATHVFNSREDIARLCGAIDRVGLRAA